MELQATQAPCLSPVSDFDDAVLGKPTWLPTMQWKPSAENCALWLLSICEDGTIGEHRECMGILHAANLNERIPSQPKAIQHSTRPMRLIGHFHTGSSHFDGQMRSPTFN